MQDKPDKPDKQNRAEEAADAQDSARDSGLDGSCALEAEILAIPEGNAMLAEWRQLKTHHLYARDVEKGARGRDPQALQARPGQRKRPERPGRPGRRGAEASKGSGMARRRLQLLDEKVEDFAKRAEQAGLHRGLLLLDLKNPGSVKENLMSLHRKREAAIREWELLKQQFLEAVIRANGRLGAAELKDHEAEARALIHEARSELLLDLRLQEFLRTPEKLRDAHVPGKNIMLNAWAGKRPGQFAVINIETEHAVFSSADPGEFEDEGEADQHLQLREENGSVIAKRNGSEVLLLQGPGGEPREIAIPASAVRSIQEEEERMKLRKRQDEILREVEGGVR